MRSKGIDADYARYRAEAPPAFLLNTLYAGKFAVKKVERGQRSVSFTVRAADCQKVEELFEKKRIPYTLIYIKGFKTRAKSLLKRLGLLAGAAIGILLIAAYYHTLTGIKISGNERVSSETIMRAVESKGIKIPSFSLRADCGAIEAELIKIEGLSAASVRKEGTRLYIEVLEELAETPIEDTHTPVPIIAEESGVVTRVIALQGTALVKTGDTVKKGQTLIAPYILDAEGKEHPVRAMGEVYARVWYEKRLIYGDTVITAVRTGRSEQKTAMWVMGLEYKPKPGFSSYETEINERFVWATMPFKLVTFTFYETEDREIPFDFEAEAPALIERGYEELEKNIPETAIKLRKWYTVKKLDKYTQLSIYYEVEKRI